MGGACSTYGKEEKCVQTLIRNPERRKSLDGVVGIATGYGLDDSGVGARVPVGSRISFSLRRPDRFWGPSNLLRNGYRGLFPRG
jgi:hypothetical protein